MMTFIMQFCGENFQIVIMFKFMVINRLHTHLEDCLAKTILCNILVEKLKIIVSILNTITVWKKTNKSEKMSKYMQVLNQNCLIVIFLF